MRNHGWLSLAAAAVLLLATPGCGEPEGPVTAVVHVNVISMEDDQVQLDRTVLVRGDTIVAIGAAADVEPPAAAIVVQGEGRFLLPGLFDTHIHLNEEESDEHLALYLANGVTTVQSMHGGPHQLELRRRVAAGELPGPTILTTGPTTAEERIDSPEKAEQFVLQQKEAGYDAIKMYGDGSNTMTRETYARLIDAAHEAGMRVVGHAPRNLPFTVVLAEGQDSIDHMEEIVYTYPPFAEALERPLDLQFGRIGVEDVDAVLTDLPQLRTRLAAAIVGLARSARAAGLAVTPTLVAFETIWLQTTERFPELLERPEMAYMSPLTRIDWGPGFNAYRRGWSDRLEAMEAILAETLDLQRGLVVGLHRAGVPLMTGTDAPLTFVYPGFSLHRELAHLADCGLTPYEALRAATVVPASELGVLDRSGTIAVGKRADLVLVEGNPLDDVANASRVAGVVVRGRYLPRSTLDGMLEELAASYAALDENVALLAPHLETGDAAALVATYRGLEQPQPELDGFVERGLNEMGYDRLGADAERAIEIFRLNVDLFGEAANPWDSLGEGLLYLGDFDESLASYERSLELDPGNDNARSRIEWVRAALDSMKSPPAVPDASLRLFAGDYGDRHVRYDQGSLYYRRGEGAERRLYPVGADTFGLEGLGMLRLQFVLRRDGAPLKVVGHYHDGRRDESPRE